MKASIASVMDHCLPVYRDILTPMMGRGGEGPAGDGPQFGSCLYYLLAMSPWVTCLIPVCFNFLICKNKKDNISTDAIEFL